LIKFSDLKTNHLYKFTFTEEKYTGFYDNALSPSRIRILAGRGNYCIGLFRVLTKYGNGEKKEIIPVFDIVAAPWKVEGSPLLAWGGFKKIESVNKEDLPLYVNEYTTVFFHKIMLGEDL